MRCWVLPSTAMTSRVLPASIAASIAEYATPGPAEACCSRRSLGLSLW